MQIQGLPELGEWWAVSIDIPNLASIADFVFRCIKLSILYMRNIREASTAFIMQIQP